MDWTDHTEAQADETEVPATSQGRAQFLSEASRLLSSSLDYEATLATVAGMALPHLGAWCFVDVQEPGEKMRRLAVIHPDPDMQELARRLESGWPPERDDPFGIPRAVRARHSEIIPTVSDQLLIEASKSEENLEVLRRLGIRSLMVVPLIARGTVLGAITYVTPDEENRYGEDDLELAEDLAARCAIAIDNAILYRDARRARDEAEAASRAKSEFLATMSHEIRTPINAVVGYVDLMETGVAGELTREQGVYLERIQASSRHLLNLINDVLDLAKVDANELQVQVEESTAGPIVDAALDLVRPLVNGRAIDLSPRCQGDPDARFLGDVDRVRQIAVNLLANAIKFTPDGGRVRVACGQSASPADARLAGDSEMWTYMRIEDTGIGIEAKDLARLFEAFMQADTGYTRAREGSGLGLAISRKLARLMNGDLTVESRPGEGSTFTLWLPAATYERREASRSLASEHGFDATDDVRGLTAVGERLLENAVEITHAFRARVREEVPGASRIADEAIQDHTVALLADLAQTLVLLENPVQDVDELLRDGGAILRTIADRHGLQRQRIGWTEDGLAAEFDLLEEVVEEAVRKGAADENGEDVERAVQMLAGMLEQARRGSLRAFRMAGRR